MGISQIKNALHELIDSDDEKLLRMFYAMALEYKSEIPQPFRPFSIEELSEEIKESEREVELGEYDSLEDFKKKAEKWELEY